MKDQERHGLGAQVEQVPSLKTLVEQLFEAPRERRRGQRREILAAAGVLARLELGRPGVASPGRMRDEVPEDARPGQQVLGPAEAEVGQVFVGDLQQALLPEGHLRATQGFGETGGPEERPGKGLRRRQNRVDVEIDASGNEPHDGSAAEVGSRQPKGRAGDLAKKQSDHGPGSGSHDVGRHLAGVEIAPDLAVLPRPGVAPRGDRARLEEEDASAGGGPFDVLRAVEKAFDLARELAEPLRQGFIQTRRVRRTVSNDAQGGFLEHDAVGIQLARHQAVAQTRRPFDDHPSGVAGDRVEGEEHACRFGRNHFLDQHGHGRIGQRPAFFGLERTYANGEQRQPALLDRGQEGIAPLNVQKGLELAGEGMVRGIFDRRTRAHGVGAMFTLLAPGIQDGPLDRRWNGELGQARHRLLAPRG